MVAAVREFLAGVRLLGRGLALITRRPRLFGMGAIPPAITSVLFLGVLIALFAQLPDLVGWLTPFADGWSPGAANLVRVLIGVATVGGVSLVMVISFTTLTLALGSPIYDKLSESVEREFGDVPELDEPITRGAARAVRQSAGLIAASAVGALILFGGSFIPVVGQIVVPVVSAIFGGWILGVELIGSAFERRGLLRIADRRAAMRRKRFRVLGLAVPTFLLLAVPFVGVVVFPIATAAGTLLARELLDERRDAG